MSLGCVRGKASRRTRRKRTRTRCTSGRPAWTGWCREVEDGNPRVTVVVRRVRGNPDVGQWPAVVGSLDDWLARLDGVRPTVRIVSTSCRAEKWLELYGRVEWDDGGRVRVVTTFADFVRAARADA